MTILDSISNINPYKEEDKKKDVDYFDKFFYGLDTDSKDSQLDVKYEEPKIDKIDEEKEKLKKDVEQLKNQLEFKNREIEELKYQLDKASIKLKKWTDQQGKGRRKRKLKYTTEQIKELREKGVTIKAIAIDCRVSPSTIKNRLKGK